MRPVADELDPSPAAGFDQGRDQEAVVHLVVTGDLGPTADRRGERRNKRATLARPEPRRLDADRLAELEQTVERGAVQGSPATTTVPDGSKPMVDPTPSSNAAANAGQRAAPAIRRWASDSSPKNASLAGASMPAATQAAPRPGSGSHTATVRPARASVQAEVRPMTPPPAITTSLLADPADRLSTMGAMLRSPFGANLAACGCACWARSHHDRCILEELLQGQRRPGRQDSSLD